MVYALAASIGAKTILRVAGLLMLLAGLALCAGAGYVSTVPLAVYDADADGDVDLADAVAEYCEQKSSSPLFDLQDFFGWGLGDCISLAGALQYACATGDWLAPLYVWSTIEGGSPFNYGAKQLRDLCVQAYLYESAGVGKLDAVVISAAEVLTSSGLSGLNPLDDVYVNYLWAAELAKKGYTGEAAFLAALTAYYSNPLNGIFGFKLW